MEKVSLSVPLMLKIQRYESLSLFLPLSFLVLTWRFAHFFSLPLSLISLCPSLCRASLSLTDSLLICIRNDQDVDLRPTMLEVFNITNEELKRGGRVLVHCAQGISRSAACIIYCMMKLEGMTIQEAFKWTKARYKRTNIKCFFIVMIF